MTKKTTKKNLSRKFIKSAKFEAKEQFTPTALNNLIEENDRLIKSLRKAGDVEEVE